MEIIAMPEIIKVQSKFFMVIFQELFIVLIIKFDNFKNFMIVTNSLFIN